MSDDGLLAQVRPEGWRSPDPVPLYDLVVIGGGTAGLVCAAGAAGLGARVALVERALLGGDCLNTGCVPSKALLRAARAVSDARAAAGSGVQATSRPDGVEIMRSVRARRVDLAHHDSAARLASIGVHVFFGAAAFTGTRTVAVGDRTLRFRRAVVATGGRPTVPAIPGLGSASDLTSETFFDLRELPRTLVVIGGGPIGCEIAQACSLLGTAVTLIEAGPRLLPREDPDAAAIVTRRMIADGVRVVTNVAIRQVARAGGEVTIDVAGAPVSAEALLVAVGRTSNVEGLGLEVAGVRYASSGVTVDDRLRTSNPRVYAAGDVCSSFKFTHAADAMARVVIQNALFYGRRRASALVIPWCTYTTPELAHVGLSADEAEQRGAECLTVPLADVDRGVIDRCGEGFLRVRHRRGRVLAATIVGPEAGELIGYLASLMRRDGRLGELAQEILPYPTLADGVRKLGDAYRRTALTPRVRAILGHYFALVRKM